MPDIHIMPIVKESNSIVSSVKESNSIAPSVKEPNSIVSSVKEPNNIAPSVKESNSIVSSVKESNSIVSNVKESNSIAPSVKGSRYEYFTNRKRTPTGSVKGCRDMTKCFTNGQRIRHRIKRTYVWIGTYDSSNNGIVYNNKLYTAMSDFATTHHTIYRGKYRSANGWLECECEVDGEWISTHCLPPFNS